MQADRLAATRILRLPPLSTQETRAWRPRESNLEQVRGPRAERVLGDEAIIRTLNRGIAGANRSASCTSTDASLGYDMIASVEHIGRLHAEKNASPAGGRTSRTLSTSDPANGRH